MLLGRYEVIRKIGVGGFGEVLLARAIGAEGFERVVALKRLKGELARKQGSLQGIINEARIGGMLNHPNIVQVLEFVQLGPDFLLVMEFVDGIALQEILEHDRGPNRILSPGLAIDITIQACEGFNYAHAARSTGGKPLRLIHRDIKPSNLMLTRTGTLKIMDFGVARSATNLGQSTTGSIKGTLRYLSPEQAEGSKEIGLESDLFSLGLVLCEMVVGHPVYEADQEHLVLLRALQARTGDSIKEAEALAPGLGAILSRCLAPLPENRYRTAEELAQALRALKVWFPVEYGLPALVERIQSDRNRSGLDDDSRETSFSLELRQKGLDRPRPGWEMLATQDGGTRPAQPAPNPAPPAQVTAPAARPAHAYGPHLVDLIDDVPSTHDASSKASGLAAPVNSRAMGEAVSSAPPSRTWEWEWHITAAPAAHSELDDFVPHEMTLDEAIAEVTRDTPAPSNLSQAALTDAKPTGSSHLETPPADAGPSKPAGEARRPGAPLSAVHPASASEPPHRSVHSETSQPNLSPPVSRSAVRLEANRPPSPPEIAAAASATPPSPTGIPGTPTPEQTLLEPTPSIRTPERLPRPRQLPDSTAPVAVASRPVRPLLQFVAGLALGILLLGLGFVLGLQYMSRGPVSGRAYNVLLPTSSGAQELSAPQRPPGQEPTLSNLNANR